jgi:hypothetical protein
MRTLRTVLTVIGAAVVLTLAANTVALGATGHALIIGKTSRTSKITTLKRTGNGPALKLHTKQSNSAPFATNARGKVVNLDADTVDGLDASVLRNHGTVFTGTSTTPNTSFVGTITVPNGSYAFTYSALLDGAENGSAFCALYRLSSTSTISIGGVARVQAGSMSPGLSAAGVITKRAGETLVFVCGADSPFTTEATTPIQLVMTPTTVTSTKPFDAPPPAAQLLRTH